MLLTMAAAVVSQAQTTAGNLDPTFGTGGTVRTDFAGNIDQANA
jgi:nucleoside diphosphate kinase